MKNKEIQKSITNTGAVQKKKEKEEEKTQKCDEGVTNLPGLFSQCGEPHDKNALDRHQTPTS